MVNTLLTELDGLNDRKGVYMVAATNRPDIIDSAMLRPGRLDQQLFVALPTPEERVEILKTLTGKKTPLAADVDLAAIAGDERARNFRHVHLSIKVTVVVRIWLHWSNRRLFLLSRSRCWDEMSMSLLEVERFLLRWSISRRR